MCTISLVPSQHKSLTALFFLFFFFNDTATTEIYTLSLHDALPIFSRRSSLRWVPRTKCRWPSPGSSPSWGDRKSTRLNSSHSQISYAVFCLKKKKKKTHKSISSHRSCLHTVVTVNKLSWLGVRSRC